MRSIMRFVFVSVPTAALASAVVVGVSRSGQGAATADGDLQRDLKLASSITLELTPVGQPLATVSAIEASPASAPARAVRPKRRAAGPRAISSRARSVAAAPEPEVAESTEESQATEVEELVGGGPTTIEAIAEPGGVALPRPTAIPVSYPGEDAGTAGADPGTGSVIRGGGVDGDHCQIGGRRPVYRQPRGGWGGITLGDRVRAATGGISRSPRPGSLGDRIRAAQGRNSSTQAGSSRGSLGGRIRAATGRR